MYISGGENVYPAEVESVLHEHDAVADAAVVGVPDERWGEVGIAFVVCEGNVGEDELIAFCRERMAAYKYPREVVVIDELPKTPTGKILRRELRSASQPKE